MFRALANRVNKNQRAMSTMIQVNHSTFIQKAAIVQVNIFDNWAEILTTHHYPISSRVVVKASDDTTTIPYYENLRQFCKLETSNS
jgi:hypothetical protein